MVFKKGHTPWNAICDKDDPRLKIIGYKKGHKPWNTKLDKNDPRRANFVSKISKAMKGKSNKNGFKKGNMPWSDGLTKDTDSRLVSVSKKMVVRLRGVKPWNTGKTIYSDPRLMKISEFQKNKIVSKETGEKISLAKKKLFSEHPEKHPNRILARSGKLSKPQMDMYNKLKEIFPDASLNHHVNTGVSHRYIDVALPSRMLAFEYNGSYWHDDVDDKIRTEQLEKSGWKVIAFNEKTYSELDKVITELKGV